MPKIIKLFFIFALIAHATPQLTFVKDLLQYNLLGVPVLLKKQEWLFDPDEGVRRSRQYQELNGKYGEKAIERLGLGVDGYDLERLEQQRIRDEKLRASNQL